MGLSRCPRSHYEGGADGRLQTCLNGSLEGGRQDESREAGSHDSNLAFLTLQPPPLHSKTDKYHA